MNAEMDEAAARWHLAQGNDDMDWAAFAAWLEADPRHREAYDAIALLDARIDAARPLVAPLLPPELEPGPVVRRFPRLAIWAAVAAVLVVALIVGITRMPFATNAETVVYRAPPGRSLQVGLAGGSTATLAPGSVLRVAASPDVPMMLDGNAYFDVHHDAARPLVVRAGGYEIHDIGTRFDISAGGGMVRVAVAEGRVSVRSAGLADAVDLEAGKVLTLTDGNGAADIRPIAAQSVGAWRNGPLVYADVPLAMVAADISRSTGQLVTVDPSIARRRFSGVIAPGDRAAMVAAIGALAGLKARTEGDAIRLGDSAGR